MHRLILVLIGVTASVTIAQPQPDLTAAFGASLARWTVAAGSDSFIAQNLISPQEAGRATMGQPIAIATLRLDSPVAIGPGGPPSGLLPDSNRFLVPVLVDGKTRFGFTFSRRPGGWVESVAGDSLLCALLVAQRASQGGGPAGFWALSIPALNLEMGAVRSGGGITLIPLLDFPPLGLQAGKGRLALDLWPALAAYAGSQDPELDR